MLINKLLIWGLLLSSVVIEQMQQYMLLTWFEEIYIYSSKHTRLLTNIHYKPCMISTVILLLWLWWDERNKRGEEDQPWKWPMWRLHWQTSFRLRVLNQIFVRVQNGPNHNQGISKSILMGLSNIRLARGSLGFIICDDQGTLVTAGAGKEAFLLPAKLHNCLACL